MSIAYILVVALSTAASAVAVAEQFTLPSTIPSLLSCLSEPAFYSCENTTTISNTCCSPTPGGLVLQTQFWDTHTGLEDQGQLLPKNSWTIHGLWPDFCDGSFTQYCDLSRQYDPHPSPNTTNGLPNGTVVPPYTGPGVDIFILEFGRIDLLDFMNKYWISQGSPNNEFWAHEFSKHATCTSTFDVACYEGYKQHEDIVNFFDAVIRAFKMFPTYGILAAAGIVPSNSTTYTLAQIQNTVKSQTGAMPFVGCRGNGTVLNEMWYFSHVLGTEQYGHFKPVDSTTESTCHETGIQYLERTPTSEREIIGRNDPKAKFKHACPLAPCRKSLYTTPYPRLPRPQFSLDQRSRPVYSVSLGNPTRVYSDRPSSGVSKTLRPVFKYECFHMYRHLSVPHSLFSGQANIGNIVLGIYHEGYDVVNLLVILVMCDFANVQENPSGKD